MKKISLLLLAFTFSINTSLAGDFYYKCDQSVEIEFNLIRGTWMSIKGLSRYWSHLMLVKVKPETLIFEVREAGEGELCEMEAEVPKGFVSGQEEGTVVLRSLHDQEEVGRFECERAREYED